MKKNVNIFKAFFRLLPMTVKAAPLLLAVTQAVSIIHGLSWGLLTLSQQRFFDSATQLAAGKIGLSAITAPLIFLGLIYISTQLLNGISNYLPGRFADKAAGGLSTIIHNKIAKISPADFENTERLDDINKAGEGKDNAVWFVFDFAIILSFYVPYFAFMAYYLFSLKPILAAAIVIVFIPTVLTQIVRTRVFSRLEDKAAPVRREFEYYEKCIVDREYFKETRMLGGFAFFKKLYLDSLSLMNRLRLKSDTRTNLYELAMQIVTVAGYLAIIWMLFDSLIKREISVGAFAAVFASIGMLFQLMREIVSMHLGQISKNLGTISNFLRFLDIPERAGADVTITPDSGVAVSGVSFAYPQAEGKAIDNMSFTIKHGETVAIVGENGSGKTTLMRLVTGLYLPDEGCVHIGGADTSDASIRSLFAETSAVFQKYQRYQMTLGDNISLSQAEKSADIGALDTASAMSGLKTDIPEFPKGYDTMLSREFDGVDLSGGQWQRVAIARGFFREHEFIVLDEPTAAIDPLEETRLYNKFAELSEGKTAFIVTHRLGSVRLADRILVLNGGRLVAEGTHDVLLSKGGEYARLYKAQQQWYAL